MKNFKNFLKMLLVLVLLAPVPLLHYYGAKTSAEKEIYYSQNMDHLIHPGETVPFPGKTPLTVSYHPAILQDQYATIVPAYDAPVPSNEDRAPDYKAVISLYNAENKPLNGAFTIVDPNSGRTVATGTSGKPVILHRMDGKMKLAASSFGYHESEMEIDPDNPGTFSSGNVSLKGNVLQISLVLKPYKKGNVMAMRQTLFHPASNVLKETSKAELDKLASLLKENQGLKIRIQVYAGKMDGHKISKAKEDDIVKLFDLASAGTALGNARKLSTLRAQSVRYYLLKNGVSAASVEISGWGEKKRLFRKKQAIVWEDAVEAVVL